MKTIITLIITLIVFILNVFSQTVNSDWQWSHPKPQGNDIRFIKRISTTDWVAVGYTGTLMRSTNSGLNWMVYSNYFGTYTSFLGQGKNIYGADFFSNTGVAAGTQGWIARTTNGGVSWDSVGSTAGTTALWNASFGDANTVYIGGNSGMVLKSVNGGLSWSSVSSPSGNPNRTIFAVDANTVFTGSTGGIVYKSVNGGSSWTPLSTGSSSIIYGVYFFNSNTGIVTGASGLVRYTTNGGSTFITPSVSLTAAETRIFGRKSPDEAYILGDANNIYKSTDYGLSWTTIPYKYSGQPVGLATNTMDISGSTIIVGGVNGLLNMSTNLGSSWTGISGVLNSINIYDVSFTSSRYLWAVGNSSTLTNCILFSSDCGNRWQIQSNFTGDLRAVSMVDNNNGWACGFNGKTVRTTNGGISWENIVIPGAGFQTLVCTQFMNVNTGWVFGYGANSIFKTTDNGSTWVTQNSGSADGGVKWASMVDVNTGYYVNGLITTTRVFKTVNGCVSWTEQNVPNPGNLWRIKMINANTGYICGDAGRLFRTTDGSNWTAVTTPTNNNYTSTDWIDINSGVLGAGSGFAAVTNNGGQSWFVKNTGGSSVWNMKMLHPDTIISVQGFGFIFKFMKGITEVTTEWKNEIPESFILKQNYPNPFNPATTIEFGLKKEGYVSLKIYDINGKLVEVLFNNIQFNPGIIKTVYNASDLSSGIYLYVLEVDNQKIDTKKMILMK